MAASNSTDNKTKQWKILQELIPIQRLNVLSAGNGSTKYGIYRKYKINLKINGVGYTTIFHDSVYNYKKHKRSANIEIFFCIFRDAYYAAGTETYQDFCEQFGYELDDIKAKKAYEGCKRAQKFFEHVLNPSDFERVVSLLDEWGY